MKVVINEKYLAISTYQKKKKNYGHINNLMKLPKALQQKEIIPLKS